MGKEYEAKFLDIDVKNIREKIKKLGGTLIHENKRYVRSIFKLCNSDKKGYARVRDEAGNVTITCKIYNNDKYPDEFEVNIKEDFETAKSLLESLNLEMKAFQETMREKWSLPDKEVHEITFDTIPGLPTYMEVDCTTEAALNKTIEKLNLDKNKMRFGSFDKTYEEYYGIEKDIINNYTSSLTFKNVLNEIKPNKNKDLLIKIHKEQNSKNVLNYKSKYLKYKKKFLSLKES